MHWQKKHQIGQVPLSYLLPPRKDHYGVKNLIYSRIFIRHCFYYLESLFFHFMLLKLICYPKEKISERINFLLLLLPTSPSCYYFCTIASHFLYILCINIIFCIFPFPVPIPIPIPRSHSPFLIPGFTDSPVFIHENFESIYLTK